MMDPKPFRPTAQCRKLPVPWIGAKPEKPLPHLTDEDIDDAICHILHKGCSISDIPTSQYGRRAAVKAYLSYEAIRPVSFGIEPPRPFEPTQPR